MAQLRGLASQLRRLRPLGIGFRGDGDWAAAATATDVAAAAEPRYEPEPALWDPAEPLPADDSEWQHYATTVRLLPQCTLSEFEAIATDIQAYDIFPPRIMKITTRFTKGGAMQPGDLIVQCIPLLPALPRLAQTLAVIRVCEVLHEPLRRGFMVATTSEHEEIASHTLWLERCSATGALLLHSRGCSRWAEHVPRWLWWYTRARYQQGHIALRQHLLKRARRVQATRRGLVLPAAAAVAAAAGDGTVAAALSLGHAMLNPRLQGWPPPPWLPGVELIFAEPSRTTGSSSNSSSLPPVIFLHGAFHSAAAFEETFLPFFAREGVAAYAMSVTGAGLSPDWRQEKRQQAPLPRLNQWLADLDVAVDEVTRRSGGQAPIIVGHSIGGGVAQVYATDSLLSRKIAGLGLGDGLAVLAGMAAVVVKERRGSGGLGDIVLAGLLGEGLRVVAPSSNDYRKLMGSSSSGGECPEHDEAEIEHLRLEPSASWVLPIQVMMRLASSNAATTTASSLLPCVVLGGGGDRLVSARVLERTAARWGVEAVRVPSVGHAIMARAGGDWEAAARALLTALEKQHSAIGVS